jgi:hypothetical protein
MRLPRQPLTQVITRLRKAVTAAAFVLFLASGVWFMYRYAVWVGSP